MPLTLGQTQITICTYLCQDPRSSGPHHRAMQWGPQTCPLLVQVALTGHPGVPLTVCVQWEPPGTPRRQWLSTEDREASSGGH